MGKNPDTQPKNTTQTYRAGQGEHHNIADLTSHPITRAKKKARPPGAITPTKITKRGPGAAREIKKTKASQRNQLRSLVKRSVARSATIRTSRR